MNLHGNLGVRVGVGSLAVMVLAGSASALLPTVKYSTIHSSATSLVPGGGGLRFGATSGSLTAFDRPFRSLSGNYWIFSALTNSGATATDEFIVAGLMGSESAQVQEGVTNLDAGRVAESASMDTKLSINDSGLFAFTANLSGATTDDEVICKATVGGSPSVVAREGGTTVIGGATFGTSLDSPTATNAGRISLRSSLTGPPTAQNAAGFNDEGGTLVFQKGVTVPAGQAGGGTAFWENVFAGDFHVAANGVDWLALGDLTGATTSDGVVAVNNTVVVQEGNPLPGINNGTNVTTLAEALMMPNGTWFARGSCADTNDWLIMNGVDIAETDDLVPGGLPGETFSDSLFAACFFTMAADNNGNFVYGGTTSNSDPEFDAVLVYNNQMVVARQGDAVDLDGNGLLDDDAFIDIFNNDDIFLLDDGTLLFTAELRNSASASIGQAVITIVIPTPGAVSALAVAGLVALRRKR